MTTYHVGLLTFHRAINFGAAMQCYSLQEVINDLGFHTEVIDYQSKYLSESNSVTPTPKQMNPKGLVGYMLKLPNRIRQIRSYNSFVDTAYNLSAPVDKDSFGAFCNRYDRIIVGSDQVWNPSLTGFDSTYLLDGISPDKRIAYAASAGLSCFPPECESAWAELIGNYHAVSVRESSFIPYLRRISGIEATNVCDPTLLHDASWWQNAFNDLRKAHTGQAGSEKPYVLVYFVANPDQRALNAAREYAAREGYETIVVHKGALPISGVKNVRDAGPVEILGLFLGAQAVITNSFHGCCFSINLEKPLCYRSNPAGGEKIHRALDLLHKLQMDGNLSDSGVPSFMTPTQETMRILCEWRAQSTRFLSASIEHMSN